MLLGFTLDYWTQEHIQNVIRSFGHLLMWDVDRSKYMRLLLHARVTSLEEIPQFIVFIVAKGFNGVSWTIQCEIIQHDMLGAQPEDEEQVPPYPLNVNELPFDFFGLGQPIGGQEGFDLNIPPIENMDDEA
jgi:hypothetical protein